MSTLPTTGAARPAPANTRSPLSKVLKGLATAAVAATIFTVQPTSQANAQWYCWSW